MRMTIATTTRDRRDAVLRLLESVAPQLEEGDELIVVDNGSVDGTADAIREWMDSKQASIVLVEEPNGGTSLARNRALEAAAAPVICFLDDDATVDAGWLTSMRAAWERSSQATAAIGGPIRPVWSGGERPPWLRDHLLWIITALDLGPSRHRLGQERIWGANMSFRVDAALSVGGFDLTLGPRPGVDFGRDEEEAIQDRLEARGYQIWWEPDAGVRHHVPEARLQVSYFTSFMRTVGARHAEGGAMTAVHAAYRVTRTAARCFAAKCLRRHDAYLAARIDLSFWTSRFRSLSGRRSQLGPR